MTCGDDYDRIEWYRGTAAANEWRDSLLGISQNKLQPILGISQNKLQPILARYGKNEWKQAKIGEGTDVCVRAGTQDFAAHKIMLMAHSSLFRNLLSQPQVLSLHDVIQLSDMDPAIFRCLLKFMYTGSLSKKIQMAFAHDFSKLAELLVKGDSLGLDGIGIWAAEFLERSAKDIQLSENVYNTLFREALRLRCDELLEAFLHHAGKILGQHILSHAVCEASLEDRLITREIWEKIKQKGGTSLVNEVSEIEHCNPYIRKLLHS